MRHLISTSRLTVLFVLIVSTFATSFAHDGPSYDQTVEYILSKLHSGSSTNITGSDNRVTREEWKYEFPERCVITYERRTYYDGDFVNRLSFDINFVSLIASEVSRGEDRAYLTGGGQAVGKKTYITMIATKEEKEEFLSWNKDDSPVCGPDRCTSIEHLTSGQLSPKDNYYLEGFQKAVKHLIKLCGGKEELF